jgi:hypothetical protein
MNQISNKNKFLHGIGALHGNNARIDPKKDIVPQFANTVFNNCDDEHDCYGKPYHRLDVDAEFDKREVDAIEL